MTKVNINGRDHQVEIHAPDDEPLEDVVTAARNLWRDTLEAEPRPGPAAAGASAERHHQGVGFAWRMGAGEQLPVRAAGEAHLEAGQPR